MFKQLAPVNTSREVIASKPGKAHRLAHRPPDWDAVNPPATNNFNVT